MTYTLSPHRRRPRTGAAAPLALLAGALLAFAVGASAASAKTVTLHLFSRQTSSTIVNSQGRPLSPTTPPAVGDTFDNTGIDYLGNHKHHAGKPNGTDHLRCTITGVGSMGAIALCSGEIAIGGSMLLANDDTLTLSGGGPPPTPINGGTGLYQHARGLLIATNIGNNSDFTIRVSY